MRWVIDAESLTSRLKGLKYSSCDCVKLQKQTLNTDVRHVLLKEQMFCCPRTWGESSHHTEQTQWRQSCSRIYPQLWLCLSIQRTVWRVQRPSASSTRSESTSTMVSGRMLLLSASCWLLVFVGSCEELREDDASKIQEEKELVS